MVRTACTLAILALGFTIFSAAQSTFTMKAELSDPERNARRQAATVIVSIDGMRLVDPAITNEIPRPGEGHLHYQVDDGPVVATPASKISFHGLSRGIHKITVTPAANDHKPLGQPVTFSITIP